MVCFAVGFYLNGAICIPDNTVLFARSCSRQNLINLRCVH